MAANAGFLFIATNRSTFVDEIDTRQLTITPLGPYSSNFTSVTADQYGLSPLPMDPSLLSLALTGPDRRAEAARIYVEPDSGCAGCVSSAYWSRVPPNAYARRQFDICRDKRLYEPESGSAVP